MLSKETTVIFISHIPYVADTRSRTGGMGWINLAQFRDRWPAVMIVVINRQLAA